MDWHRISPHQHTTATSEKLEQNAKKTVFEIMIMLMLIAMLTRKTVGQLVQALWDLSVKETLRFVQAGRCEALLYADASRFSCGDQRTLITSVEHRLLERWTADEV